MYCVFKFLLFTCFVKKEDFFYLFFIIAIVATRWYLAVFPSHLVIVGFTIHHFWTGLVLTVIAFLLSSKFEKIKLILFGVGLGLLVDEFVFIMVGGYDFEQYWAFYSVVGVFVLLWVVYFFRMKIVKSLF